jgi:hypothetical protein
MRFLPHGKKIAGAVLLAALVWLGASAPAALAGPVTGSVTVVGETGNYVTGGHAYRFDSATGSISLSGGYLNGPSVALVSVSGDGSALSLSFAAPVGQTLQVGAYTSATRYPFETSGQAGIDVSGDGRGCNEEYGRFDVRDVDTDATGSIDRLWLVYEVHCESPGSAAVFGEVRINEPSSAASPYAEPSGVVWPGNDIGRPARVVPVRIFAGPTDRKIASVALSGPGASDFSIRLDECTGETLAAATGCDVFPRYTPTSPGSSAAAYLAVTMTDSSEVDVPLAGFAYGGTTRMDLQSDAGDWVGGGVNSSYDETTANITASGTRESVSFSVSGYDGTYMTATFTPGRNDILVPGFTYTQASRAPFSNGGTGLEVDGNGHGCNELSGQFTVTDVNFDPAGNLLDAGVTFVQHCELGVPALRGAFQWRARTPAAIAPWNLSPPTVPGTVGVGTSLQANPGTWAVADASLSYGYQWLSCDAAGAACDPIPSAIDSTYTPGAQDVGHALRVTVTATNAGGPSEPLTSAATAAVAAVHTPIDPGTPPAGSSPPAPSVAPAVQTSATQTTAPDSASPAALPTSRAAAAAPAASSSAAPLTETISVGGHQSARTVAASGLAVTVSCSQACTASITVRGAATARTAAATARVSLRAGVRKTLRLRVHGGVAKHLTLTSTAQQAAAPHGVASPLTRRLSLS